MSSAVVINEPKISEILKKLLSEKCLNVSELARRTRIPQSTIQRIAAGTHHRPQQKTLEGLAKYFEISLNQLMGFDPIPWLSKLNNKITRRIPLLNMQQAIDWPKTPIYNQEVIADVELGSNSFAMTMPDASMEPLIVQGSILLIDPCKIPQYRNYIVVKIDNHQELLIRQLIKDGNNSYIKPLCPDLNQFKMQLIGPNDKILGVIVQVRMNC